MNYKFRILSFKTIFKLNNFKLFLNSKFKIRNCRRGFTQHHFFCKKNGAGFTLIETLIYIAIIGGVVATFVNFSLTISDSRNKTYVVQEVQANARTALDLITQNIQSANGINTSISIFGSDPGLLSLSMTSSTLNPTVIGLSEDDGILEMKQGTSASTTITSDELNITNLIFTNLTASSTRENVRIEIMIGFDNPGGDIEFDYSQSLQTGVSLRQ